MLEDGPALYKRSPAKTINAHRDRRRLGLPPAGRAPYMSRPRAGPMAEWLCRGLQILVQRFDSASGLHCTDELGSLAGPRSRILVGALRRSAAGRPGNEAFRDLWD